MKGEETRRQVVERAAALFNQIGYQATSISDVMAATGLKKGGIYRHFESKEELTLEAFDFAVEKMRERFTVALRGKITARDRLRAIIAVYETLPTDPPVPGGCPLLNASVEADDANPALRTRADSVMDSLLRVVEKTIKDGQRARELSQKVRADSTAAFIVASLEGAVMLSKLQGSPRRMKMVTRNLHRFIDQMAR